MLPQATATSTIEEQLNIKNDYERNIGCPMQKETIMQK
jgi:hypothetical protein